MPKMDGWAAFTVKSVYFPTHSKEKKKMLPTQATVATQILDTFYLSNAIILSKAFPMDFKTMQINYINIQPCAAIKGAPK